MTAYSSKGVDVKLYPTVEDGAWPKAGGANIALIKTIALGLNPAITVEATGYTPKAGDVIRFAHRTGMGDAIDGKSFVVSVSGGTIRLVGADTTASGTFQADPKGEGKTSYEALSLPETAASGLCLTGIDFATVTPNTISIATFCDPAATISGAPARGTMTITGQVDANDAGYKLLSDMDRHSKSEPFTLVVKLPDNQGHIFASGFISSINIDIPLDGVVGFSCEMQTFGNADHRYSL